MSKLVRKLVTIGTDIDTVVDRLITLNTNCEENCRAGIDVTGQADWRAEISLQWIPALDPRLKEGTIAMFYPDNEEAWTKLRAELEELFADCVIHIREDF